MFLVHIAGLTPHSLQAKRPEKNVTKGSDQDEDDFQNNLTCSIASGYNINNSQL